MAKAKNKIIKVLILGSTGQLGSDIYNKLKTKKYIKILNNKKFRLNFLKKRNLKENLKNLKPGIIINCSAFTDVEISEVKKTKARIINADALKIISKYCINNDTTLIHFSTDYVFNSKFKKLFKEDSYTNPINYYGKTKLLGEKYIKKYMNKFYIFRVSWLYSKSQNNFYTKIKKKILNKNLKKINVVNDQFGCPLSTEYVSNIISNNFIDIKNAKLPFGIYNISTKNYTSWYLFAKYINYKLKLKNKIFKVKTSALNLKAKRPKYSILKFSYFRKLVKRKKTWQELFDDYIVKYKL